MESISGEWSGHFTYGPGYDKLRGTSVPFTLFLEDLGDDQFKGTCIDEETIERKIPPAAVKGFLEDNYVSFIKQYENLFKMDKQGNKVPVKSLEVPELRYEGSWDPATELFTGIWELEGKMTLFGIGFSHNRIIGEGTWEMSKKKV